MTRQRKQTEIERLKQFHDLVKDERPGETGVLLYDQIKFYVNECRMICPFDSDNLKPAGYELTVGDEAMLGGEHCSLDDSTQKGRLTIPPFEVAVIKTAETLNLPRFLVARWNIRVAWAYKGLVWVGGPQVDPGYVGHLFCPIYNLSNKPVSIKKGDPIALMDFVKTTSFDERTEQGVGRYRRPPKRVIMEDYGIDDFRSALREQAEAIPKLEKSIEENKKSMEEDVREIRRNADYFTLLIFTIIAILMAAIVSPYVVGDLKEKDVSIWNSLPIGLSLFAALLSLLTLFSSKIPTRMLWTWLAIVAAIAVAAAVIVAVGTFG